MKPQKFFLRFFYDLGNEGVKKFNHIFVKKFLLFELVRMTREFHGF